MSDSESEYGMECLPLRDPTDEEDLGKNSLEPHFQGETRLKVA